MTENVGIDLTDPNLHYVCGRPRCGTTWAVHLAPECPLCHSKGKYSVDDNSKREMIKRIAEQVKRI